MENRADNLPSLVHQASKPGPRSSQSCLAAKSSHNNFLIFESTKYIKLSTPAGVWWLASYMYWHGSCPAMYHQITKQNGSLIEADDLLFQISDTHTECRAKILESLQALCEMLHLSERHSGRQFSEAQTYKVPKQSVM